MRCQMLQSDSILIALMNPPMFVRAFETMWDFKQWLRLGEIEDIDHVRDLFESFELYEHCQACVEVIKEKDAFDIWNPNT